MKRGDARNAQSAEQVGFHYCYLLFQTIAQTTTPVVFHDGFIHGRHRLRNYDTYDMRSPESSKTAMEAPYFRAVKFET